MTKVSASLMSSEVSLLGLPVAAFPCPRVAFPLLLCLPTVSRVSRALLVRALLRLD